VGTWITAVASQRRVIVGGRLGAKSPVVFTAESPSPKDKGDEPSSPARRRWTALGELTQGVLRDLDDQDVALGPVHHLSRDGTELMTLYGA
jgi:hypothetical protein